MLMRSWFVADSTDPRLQHIWRHTNGHSSTSYNTNFEPEVKCSLGAVGNWGWLDESQVRCIEELDITQTVELTTIAQPGDGFAMVAIQLSSRDVIVIESRRQARLRRRQTPHCGQRRVHDASEPDHRRRAHLHSRLAHSQTGELPLKIAGDSGDGQVDDFPVLQVGESVTVRGYIDHGHRR